MSHQKGALIIQIFSTSVHPVVQPRRTQQAPATPGAEQGNNTPARRAGQAGVTRDPTQPNGRGFGNFGRGDGGILSAGGIKSGVIGGGALASPAGDGKAPGVLGGGFGGVGKRLVRGRNDNPDSPSGTCLPVQQKEMLTVVRSVALRPNRFWQLRGRPRIWWEPESCSLPAPGE